MGDIEAMLREIVRIADDDTIGYSQPDRLGRHNVDCSELMRLGLLAGGWPINYLWTGNMHQELPRVGWTWHPGTDGIRRGDILWKQGHTAAYLGGGQRAEAWIAEDGSIDGRPGDQTGQEVRVHTPWNDVAWSGYFRAPAGSTYTSQSEEDDMQISEIYAWRDRDGRNLLDQGYEDRRLALSLQEEVRALKAALAGVEASTFGRQVVSRGDRRVSALQELADTKTLLLQQQGTLAGVSTALQQVATAQGIDPEAITRAVTEAVQAGLADVSITLTAKEA